MTRKTIATSISSVMIAAFVLTSATERASADLKDVLGGAAAVGIIGCATGAFNCGRKQQTRQRTTTAAPRRSSINSAQRQQNRDVQSSLNAFGFPVGTVDGSLGPRSRNAIGDYQSYMGYPRTGQLTDFERRTLVDSWQRFNAGGGAAYPRTMAAVGPRGLLRTAVDPNFPAQFGDQVVPNGQQNWNGQQAGAQQPYQPVPQPQVPQAVQPAVPQAVQPAPQAALQDVGGQVIGDGVPKLKPLQPIGVNASAAARCELVDQTTRIQGGAILASNITDPHQALSEKFCEARGFAITQGQSTSAAFAVSETELSGVCEQIKTAYSPNFGTLPTASHDQAVASAQTVACLLYTSPSPRDRTRARMPSSA